MSKTIVVAEDDPIIRMDICEILKEEGYTVVGEAKDGLEAVNLCKEKKPDIILLDIKMPIITGLQVSKILKDDNINVCIIFLTAYNIEEYIEIANENYASGYLLKPIEEKPFLAHIKLIYKNFEELKKLKKEIVKSKDKLYERKVIEKAKGIIISKKNISEEKAYKFLRDLSMEKRISIYEISKIIASTGEII